MKSAPTRPDLLRWQQLVTPTWLAALMQGQAVAGCGEPAEFLHSHIPGACYLDTHQLEDGPFWNKVADAELLALGVRHDTTVVPYVRSTTAGDAGGAFDAVRQGGRCAAAQRGAGHLVQRRSAVRQRLAQAACGSR